MNAFESAPPSTDSRLYIGGLSDVVTEAALVTLLKPFGQACNVERHPRGFAHVTLNSVDRSVFDRCVSTLNRTMWCGSVLRVEPAREHFAHRLRREWSEATDPLPHDRLDITATKTKTDFSSQSSSSRKHIYFDIANDAEGIPFDSVTDAVNADDPDSSSVPPHVRSSPRLRSDKLASIGVRSSAVASTLSLFGLSIHPTLPLPELPSARELSPPLQSSPSSTGKKRSATTELASSTAPIKHSRIEHNAPNINLVRACAVENDASLIDLGVERKVALSVLQNMFPEEDLGLYGPNEPSVCSKACSDNVRRNGLYRHLGDKAGNIIGRTKNPPTILHSISAHQPLQIRQKGLYKKLLS